jgi:uncharacterized membrane protein
MNSYGVRHRHFDAVMMRTTTRNTELRRLMVSSTPRCVLYLMRVQNGRSSQAFWVHLSTGVGTFLEAVKLQKNMDVVVVFLFSKTRKSTGRESWRALFALLFPHKKGCSMQERMLEIDGEGSIYPLIPGSKILDDVR